MQSQQPSVTRSRRLQLFGLVTASLIACLCVSLLNTTVVRAKQDVHAVAPQSAREVGATGTNTYTGDAKCLTCHAKLAPQKLTGMGLAALDPRGTLPLNYTAMSYHDGNYTVTMQKNKEGLQMTASDGTASASAPVRWIFGQGHSGQTFILERDGRFYESRASYYTATSNLDLTIGHSPKPPVSAIAALGRLLPDAEVKKCFSCHTSEDVFAGKLDISKAHPGITCENCHGAGGEHAVAMASTLHGGPAKQNGAIFNPGSLAPADINDFCGSCHRTTRDVLDSGIRDIRNIRFQPYRLENSKCYDPSDPRITCIACHDPHRNLETSAQKYDDKCLACHSVQGVKSAQAKAPACPRATKDCTSCHMPKLNLPGAHYAFTDHYIRVVQQGAPYPD